MHTCKIEFVVELPFNKTKFQSLIKLKKLPNDIKPEEIEIKNIDDIEKELKNISQNFIFHLRFFKIINDDYDVYVSNMITKLINQLDEKKLIELKNKYNLSYKLLVIQHIDTSSTQPNQCLSINENIIDFLYKTKTRFDLDYYII